MCALYVEMMYAGRIRLGWAHDVLLLHVTSSCIFSCICTIFFLSYWYRSVLVLFCLSLSFSLSFILSVSCSMAPKCKSAPSRNPLHSRASTSDSTPSHIRFCDEKANMDFSENFSRRGIHLERQVILTDFFDTNLPTIIYSRVWESLCGIPVTCPSVIIQEFYFNMHGFDYWKFK